MKKATFTVTTTNGKTLTWKFQECESNLNDYGNKKYIVYTTPSGEVFSIDCRYNINYDFIKICVEFLLNYYGKNLDELWRED
mgnify:CR=1 FL=1